MENSHHTPNVVNSNLLDLISEVELTIAWGNANFGGELLTINLKKICQHE